MGAGWYCPVCRRYSDRFPTPKARDAHLIDVHPDSEFARLLIERQAKQTFGHPTGKAT